MNLSSVIVFIAVCVAASKSQDFPACPSLVTDITSCSTQFLQGLSIKGLFTDITKGLDLTSVASTSITTFCQSSTKVAVFEFYGCVYEKFRACIPPEWQKVVPSIDQRKQSFNYMCDNINDVDFICVGNTEKITTLTNCVLQGTKGGSSLSTPDAYLAFACSALQLSQTCLETAYGSCPKRTAEVLAEMEKISRPAGCDACVSRPSLLLLLLVSVLTFMLASFK